MSEQDWNKGNFNFNNPFDSNSNWDNGSFYNTDNPINPGEPDNFGSMPGPGTVANPPQQKPRRVEAVSNKAGDVERLKELGQLNVPEQKSNIHCLTIVGQVEGHMVMPPQNKTTKYEHIIPQLVAVEENPAIEGVIVVLNTVGGDVEAGLAIAEMITSLSKPSVCLVLGGGHSIGVPIAVSGDYSFIAETAGMTIHPIRLTGLVIGVPQTYEYLDKMQDRVVSFVTNHSNVTEDKFRELMFRTGQLARDIGTVLIGNDAVDVGLIDEVGGLNGAIKKLQELIDQKKTMAGGQLQ